ncbi:MULTISPECIES: hypothetical protein [unclassified Polaromonas]|jgi:hypothetical protein|uniref:hypothetical protein n=1 Tax=unclassified Polaromonas TaxID=2638319 RepID=UPI0025FB5EE8|nr:MULTISPECIES: hypothetical protein [unclassified Polaromonas]HQR97565.1 hypothetical protein [Polaromonas sp.]HQS40059.1 hypothetical protein [Polaromonas sp.]HQS85501.1 hypothetical protein [Polaromonas sp.]HQT08669.1 hypothetical protein [Polaromonas sp.]
MTSKTVYLYDKNTGEFAGRYDAQESPLEPGTFITPVCSASLPPPATGAHEAAVFVNGEWAITPNYRGVSYWLNGVEGRVEALGVAPPEGSTPAKPPPALADVKAELVALVDGAISGIYSRFTRFESEYTKREDAARAFKAGGYAGDAGSWVTAFATNAGLTSQVAADLIIQQADQLRGALELLAAQRMRKYGIAAAADAAAAQALHDDIVAQAMVIAATL